MESASNNRTPIARLILVPSVITLVITLLRITGELRHWSPTLFNSSPGGGGALVGITWLVLIFGVYFALKLSSDGKGPASTGRSIGMAAFGVLLMAGGGFVAAAPQVTIPGKLFIGLLLFAAATALQFKTWPASVESAASVWLCGTNSGGHRDVFRHPGKLGHPLRRLAAGIPGNQLLDEISPDCSLSRN